MKQQMIANLLYFDMELPEKMMRKKTENQLGLEFESKPQNYGQYVSK